LKFLADFDWRLKYVRFEMYATKERRAIVTLVETKRTISFLLGFVVVWILWLRRLDYGDMYVVLAIKSLATKPERFSCEMRPILPLASF
jgi:hypothetical protein